MTSDDKIPGLVAVFISVLVCFPCACSAGCSALTNLALMLDPELAAELQLVDEFYTPAYFEAMTLTCSGTAIIALVGGIILLIWGIRRQSGKLV